jgi:hypothetical protein
MTGNSSLLSHTSSPYSPSFVTVANGTKTSVQGKGTVTTSDLTLSDVFILTLIPFQSIVCTQSYPCLKLFCCFLSLSF